MFKNLGDDFGTEIGNSLQATFYSSLYLTTSRAMVICLVV